MKSSGNRRITVLRTLAVALVLAGLLAQHDPRGVSAAKSSPGHFRSQLFGFAIDYDEASWTPSDLELRDDQDGVKLENDLSWVNVTGVTWESMDEEACLEYMVENFKTGDGLRNFRRASRSLET